MNLNLVDTVDSHPHAGSSSVHEIPVVKDGEIYGTYYTYNVPGGVQLG